MGSKRRHHLLILPCLAFVFCASRPAISIPTPRQVAEKLSEKPLGVRGVGRIADGLLLERVKDDLRLQICHIDIHWKSIAEHSWHATDQKILKIQEMDMDVFAAIWPNHPGYCNCVLKNNRMGLAAPPKNQEAMAAWRGFVRSLARRYGTVGKPYSLKKLKRPVELWQFGNEMTAEGFWNGTAKDYIRTQAVTYSAIHEVLPDAVVILGGIGLATMEPAMIYDGFLDLPYARNVPPRFFSNEEVRKSPDAMACSEFWGAILRNAQYDAIDLHLYGRYQTIPQSCHWARMTSGRADVPLLSSEHGGPSLIYNEKYTGKLHAEEIIKRHALMFASGIKLAMIMRLHDQAPQVHRFVSRANAKVSLLDEEQRKKPGFYAWRFFHGLTKGMTGGRLLNAETVELYAPGKRVIVAWSDHGEKRQAFHVNNPGAVTVYRMTYQADEKPVVAFPRRTITPQSGEIVLNTGEMPVMIVDGYHGVPGQHAPAPGVASRGPERNAPHATGQVHDTRAGG